MSTKKNTVIFCIVAVMTLCFLVVSYQDPDITEERSGPKKTQNATPPPRREGARAKSGAAGSPGGYSSAPTRGKAGSTGGTGTPGGMGTPRATSTTGGSGSKGNTETPGNTRKEEPEPPKVNIPNPEPPKAPPKKVAPSSMWSKSKYFKGFLWKCLAKGKYEVRQIQSTEVHNSIMPLECEGNAFMVFDWDMFEEAVGNYIENYDPYTRIICVELILLKFTSNLEEMIEQGEGAIGVFCDGSFDLVPYTISGPTIKIIEDRVKTFSEGERDLYPETGGLCRRLVDESSKPKDG